MPGPSPTLQRELTSNRVLERIQDHVRDALQQLLKNVALFGGVLTPRVTLQPNQDNQVQHGLNRLPRGFFVVYSNQPGVVYESSNTNAHQDLQLFLRTSAPAAHMVAIWFF